MEKTNLKGNMSNSEKLEIIKNHIRSYPDFPKKGVLFRDLFSVLLEPSVFQLLREVIVDYIQKNIPDTQCIAALESRGFLVGPIIALDLKLPFIPIRKRGKLPGKILAEEYTLEYGKDVFEIQVDSTKKGMNVLVVDDLLATGGSLSASNKLIEKNNAKVVGCLVIMELLDLKGRSKVTAPLHSLIKY